MTRRTVLGGIVVTLGVVAMLVASDVRSLQRSLSSGDAVYAAAPRSARWAPPTRVGNMARDLLGVQGSVAARHALRLYRMAAATHFNLGNGVQVQTKRAAAQDALEALARSGDAKQTAQALTLLGILAYGATARGDQNQAEAATADFSGAIAADPGNTPAKFDLELLLRLAVAQGTRTGQGLGGGFGRGGHRGAGGGTPGHGY